MDRNMFYNKLKEELEIFDITIEEEKQEKFYLYTNILKEWNEKINLTAITKEEEIITKHFVDSLSILKHISNESNILDVGTGAGFPGIPLKILLENSRVTLLDSLNKRIEFLKEVISQLELKNIEPIHARAEELAKQSNYREKYDVVVSRAVAKLNILLEYMLPFTKVGGICICLKGNNISEEFEESKHAIKILGGKYKKIEQYRLPNSEVERNILIIEKISETPSVYPRKAGTPEKKPL